MTTSRKLLCAVYAIIALAALVATWSQNVAYLDSGAAGFLTAFVDGTRATPASRSITVDILLFFLAAAIFMVIEACKLRIRYVWAYIVGGALIAISVTFPLFLIARERELARSSELTRLPVVDKALLALFTVAIAALAVHIELG